jgi:hypothetical protein
MSIKQTLDLGLQNHPHLLHTYKFIEGLVVYRSVLVSDTDDIYQPVVKAVQSQGLIEVFRLRFEDEDMMFGEAEVIHFENSGGGSDV